MTWAGKSRRSTAQPQGRALHPALQHASAPCRVSAAQLGQCCPLARQQPGHQHHQDWGSSSFRPTEAEKSDNSCPQTALLSYFLVKLLRTQHNHAAGDVAALTMQKMFQQAELACKETISFHRKAKPRYRFACSVA